MRTKHLQENGGPVHSGADPVKGCRVCAFLAGILGGVNQIL